ncbi:MAG: hypothetical protein WAU01_15470 [Saprospiraceae bacterium]
MKYIINTFSIVFIFSHFVFVSIIRAQEQPSRKSTVDKAVKASERIRQKSIENQEKTTEISQNIQSAGDQVKSMTQNVKSVINVFEPILRLRLRKSVEQNSDNQSIVSNSSESVQNVEGQNDTTATEGGLQETPEETILIPESSAYNPDATANLGNQNHQQFGCYLNIMQGQVLDDIDASDNTTRVDLIFTATDYFGSAPMYALLTPAYVKNDLFSNYYFRGPNFKDNNIPVKQWLEVNESEIALTNLTAEKFDKIQNNNQLMSVVKLTPGFKEKFESRTKINGKVFAIRTEVGNRQAYGLMLVSEHLGTTGTSGYLKIRLKVTGFDNNGDGIADTDFYR